MVKAFGNAVNKYTHFLFTVPAFVLYTVFFMVPMAIGIFYSLTNWDGFRKSYKIIGLDNYVKLFQDDRIMNSMGFTLRYTLLLVIFTVAISLGLALLLNTKLRLQTFFRSIYFLPAVLSLLTVALVFNQIFYEVFPLIGKALGIDFLSTNILADSKLAQFGVLFVNLWQGVPIPTVLFIAALQSVPRELIEAAQIDGATAVQRFKAVQLPFLITVTNLIIILTLKSGLTLFDYIAAMTGGGPGRSTESLGVLIYNMAFTEMNFSYSITVSVVLFFIMGAISIYQLRFSSRYEVK